MLIFIGENFNPYERYYFGGSDGTFPKGNIHEYFNRRSFAGCIHINDENAFRGEFSQIKRIFYKRIGTVVCKDSHATFVRVPANSSQTLRMFSSIGACELLVARFKSFGWDIEYDGKDYIIYFDILNEDEAVKFGEAK